MAEVTAFRLAAFSLPSALPVVRCDTRKLMSQSGEDGVATDAPLDSEPPDVANANQGSLPSALPVVRCGEAGCPSALLLSVVPEELFLLLVDQEHDEAGEVTSQHNTSADDTRKLMSQSGEDGVALPVVRCGEAGCPSALLLSVVPEELFLLLVSSLWIAAQHQRRRHSQADVAIGRGRRRDGRTA
jgi:hypothetical protein